MAHEMISVLDSPSRLFKRVSSGQAQELSYAMVMQITSKTDKRIVSLPDTLLGPLPAQISTFLFLFLRQMSGEHSYSQNI